MKILRFFVALSLFLLIDFCLADQIFASEKVLFINDSFSLLSIYDWCVAHWAVIALVVSEIAALLPGKISGILSSVLHIGDKLFKKKGG